MNLNTPDVSDDLKQEPAEHAGHITPCFILDAEKYLGDEENAEDGEEDDVPGQVRDVFEVGILHGACLYSAELCILEARSIESDDVFHLDEAV